MPYFQGQTLNLPEGSNPRYPHGQPLYNPYEIIQGVEKPYPLVNIYMTMEIHHS